MTLADIPRHLHHGNIDKAINDYKILLQDVPLKIEESNLLDLLKKLKRSAIEKGPYPKVSIFEAANRIMTDLVILFGVKKLLSGEIKNLSIFSHFDVELGNENRNPHDILSNSNGTTLAGEAFNVAPSFFHGKKSSSIKKLLDSKLASDYSILLCNDDSHGLPKIEDTTSKVQIIRVKIVI